MIRFLRWLVRLEVGIWRSLFLWVFRRVPGRGPRSDDFSYAKEVTPIIPRRPEDSVSMTRH